MRDYFELAGLLVAFAVVMLEIGRDLKGGSR